MSPAGVKARPAPVPLYSMTISLGVFLAALGMVTVRNRRSGKFLDQEGETKPDFEIQTFWDLLDILRDRFQVKV